jgi:hypothetical protein
MCASIRTGSTRIIPLEEKIGQGPSAPKYHNEISAFEFKTPIVPPKWYTYTVST